MAELHQFMSQHGEGSSAKFGGAEQLGDLLLPDAFGKSVVRQGPVRALLQNMQLFDGDPGPAAGVANDN